MRRQMEREDMKTELKQTGKAQREAEKFPTIGIKSENRELALCAELYSDFRTVLNGEADVVLY